MQTGLVHVDHHVGNDRPKPAFQAHTSLDKAIACIFLPNTRHYRLGSCGLTRCVLRSPVFMFRPTSFKLVLAGFLLAALVGSGLAQARPASASNLLTTITVAELPRPGAEIYGLIHQGGPFAHDQDGRVFGNRERLLPNEKRGYYREYTVTSPDSRDRGVRRIVCGGPAKVPDNCYYTGDHYASFRRIVP